MGLFGSGHGFYPDDVDLSQEIYLRQEIYLKQETYDTYRRSVDKPFLKVISAFGNLLVVCVPQDLIGIKSQVADLNSEVSKGTRLRYGHVSPRTVHLTFDLSYRVSRDDAATVGYLDDASSRTTSSLNRLIQYFARGLATEGAMTRTDRLQVQMRGQQELPDKLNSPIRYLDLSIRAVIYVRPNPLDLHCANNRLPAQIWIGTTEAEPDDRNGRGFVMRTDDGKQTGGYRGNYN